MASRDSLVKGKSTKQILEMDVKTFNALSEGEMRTLVTRISSAANKRIRTLEKLPLQTPALTIAKKYGGHFTASGKKDLAQLRIEFTRIRNFMSVPTSSKKGAEEYISKMQSALADAGLPMDPAQIGEMWSIYDKLKERYPKIADEENKYKTIEEIVKRQEKGQDMQHVLRNMRRLLKKSYEEEQEQRKNDGVSRHFRGSGNP